ncbi:MAG: hypothetical protein IIT73_05820, partial [Treponema sp.]|nr:hypothetical protein [Treponema sp.]
MKKILAFLLAAYSMIFLACTTTSFTVHESEPTTISKAETFAITVPNDYPNESKSGITTSL